MECRRACFGSALNLNVHLHMLFLDGAYRFSASRPAFHRACPPAGEELNDLLDTLSRRIVRVLEEASSNPLLARRSGFSLHAATVCEAWTAGFYRPPGGIGPATEIESHSLS